MIKYCFIKDEETGLVQIGVGCPDEYYIEIGMKQRDVEQSEKDFQWYLAEKCPHYTEEEKLEIAKNNKFNEALNCAYDFEQNGTVEFKNCIFEMSVTNRNNLRDTVEALTALGETETTWNDKNDELVVLTIEDIQYIRLNLILGAIQKLWIEDYPQYKQAIAEAETVEEVEAIDINYGG